MKRIKRCVLELNGFQTAYAPLRLVRWRPPRGRLQWSQVRVGVREQVSVVGDGAADVIGGRNPIIMGEASVGVTSLHVDGRRRGGRGEDRGGEGRRRGRQGGEEVSSYDASLAVHEIMCR